SSTRTPSIPVCNTRTVHSLESPSLQKTEQILTVAVFSQGGSERFQLFLANKSKPEGNLLWTCDLQSLSLLDGLYKGRRLKQGVVRSRVEPCHAPAQNLGIELLPLQIPAVDVGDLKFTSRGRPQRSSYVHYLRIVEVKPGYRIP